MEPTASNQAPAPAPKKSSKAVGVVVGILIVLVAVIVVLASKKSPATPDQAAPSAQPASSDTTDSSSNPAQVPPTDTTNSVSSEYKDGTYTATGSYMSPGGPDKIGVTLTLKNDIITSVTATPMPGDPTSARYQNKFMSGYQALVVGQDISSVHLTKVSGSSLTPAGFDDALSQIEAQAKA